MYYQLDKDGFYLGIKSESNEKMEFWTETPISGNFTKHRLVNHVWIEGSDVVEQPRIDVPQEVLDFIAMGEKLKETYNL